MVMGFDAGVERANQACGDNGTDGNRAVYDNNSFFYNVCFLNVFSLSRDDIDFLLEKTSFDEYDIREWFRAFIKVFI